MNAINASDALARLRATGSLADVVVSGSLVLDGDVQHEIRCTDCKFDDFLAACAVFSRPVHFRNCTFQRCCFYAAYFLRGLAVLDCTYRSQVTFQSGGHNAMDFVFEISDSVFDQFVDFEDCWFTGPVTIRNVNFCAATNLLGNIGTPMEVAFDQIPTISETIGELRTNTFSRPTNQGGEKGSL